MFRTDGAWPARHNLGGSGIGLGFGRRIIDGFGADFDLSALTINLLTPTQEDSLHSISLMGGLKYGHELFGFVTPYLGAGAGLAALFNTINYRETNQIGMDSSIVDQSFSAARFNLAWYAKAGLTFGLSEKFDLDLNVKFQNLGRAPNRVGVFNIVGNVTNLQFAVGVAYKW